MKRFILIILALLIFTSSFGSKMIVDPWLLKAGDISFSLGVPTLGLRYGLIDIVEIGASLREMGGYIKIGYSSENFAVNVGYASIGFGLANVFGALGIRVGGLEMAMNARYFQYPKGDGVGESYTISGETSMVVSKSGNMTSSLGIYGYYPLTSSHELGSGGVYARGEFENVWIFKKVNLMGGISLRIDDSFNLFEDVGITFDLSIFLNIFRR